MPEDTTTLSIILLVCTIVIAFSNALTAYAIYWERKMKNAPPFLGFRISGSEVNRPEFIVENPSEHMYQIVQIQFGGLKIHNFETQNHKGYLKSNDTILFLEKLKPGDLISGNVDINNPNKANPFFVECRISTPPGKKKNIVSRKGLFHYFKELDTNKIFYVWSVSKLTFISKFKHNMNLCHCQKELEDYYVRKFQRIDSFHSLKDASLRTK